jgi:hypothetical protein
METGPSTSAEIDYARQCARAGLWISPGFFFIAAIAATVIGRILNPERNNVGRGLMLIVLVVSALLHLGSLMELLVVVKYLGHRPLPRAVLLLVGYWVLLPAVVLLTALAR